MARAPAHRGMLEAFLAEDLGRGDATCALLPRGRIRARVVSRERATVSGAAHARDLFRMSGCSARVRARDGSRVRAGGTVLEVSGDARGVLGCERTALNLLSRMSGIATATAGLVSMVPAGVGVYATRKTAPGLRIFDKEAVEDGGGRRHRMSLGESVMIKDNHIAAAGSMVRLVREARRRRRAFEVEVESPAEALLAAREGAPAIMLDNFTPAQARRTVALLRRHGLRGGVTLEASGGITARNIAAYGRSGVDRVSAGAITASPRSIDMSLEVERAG